MSDSKPSASSSSPTAQDVLENEELLFSILNYCDDQNRHDFIFLSSKYYSLLTSDTSFKWRVECLHRELGIYHPSSLVPSHCKLSSWKDVFLTNNKIKNLWQKNADPTPTMEVDDNELNTDPDDKLTEFHVQVSARFKPRNKNPGTSGNVVEKKISLPLYQRLALIQMSRNLKTKKEAFEVLFEQGEWSSGETKSSKRHEEEYEDKEFDDEKKNDTDKDETQAKPSLRGGVHLIDPRDNFAVLIDPTKGLRRFDFDNVFSEYCEQDFVYQKTAMPLIWEYINGFNVSCIVYGQTGSGKTHTMYGDNDFKIYQDGILPPSWGVVPRSVYEVFQAIEYRKKNINLDFDVEIGISYIEIFGDSVTDLLRGGKSCGQSKVATQRYVLDGSSEKIVTSMNDTLELLNIGEKQKRKAATAMNERSSRAHSIFIMRMTQTCRSTGVKTKNRLLLADLGGSEQLKKSQPLQTGDQKQNDYVRKQRAREAVNINLGLLALKQCVEALNKRASFVPYTDSKLTMLLSTGLGGDSKTSIIVCGAQEQRHGNETISAMKFGQVCRGIHNNAKITNTNMIQELLENIDNKIANCEENIKKYERWEMVKQVHQLEDGKFEEKQVTIVTGAEKYREELSELVRQKMELTGDSVTTLYGNANEIEGFGNAHVYNMGSKVM